MSNRDPWKPFADVVASPWKAAQTWKETTGAKVIGHLLPDVPEEIIHAAGALPVAVQGAGINISRAQAHIPGYTCSHAMGALELGLRGDLTILDGMVIPYVCDTTRNLFHIWCRCFPDMRNEFLRLPKRVDFPGAQEYLEAEFARLLQAIGDVTGKLAFREDLQKSISLYNRSRARLRQAYRKQQEQPTLWTLERVQLLFASALKAPREDHLRWMEELPWDDAAGEAPRTSVPVYVRGKIWDPPGLPDLFDKLGLLLVGDEIVTGWRAVALDAEVDGDPIKALAERHLGTIPYAGYHMAPDRLTELFVDRVRSSQAKGVIFLNPKFCEAAAFDTPDFQKALQEAGVPSIILETSARGTSLDQVRLRLEAFTEMLSGDLP